MPVTVNVNSLSVVHRGSGGIATATMPDVCKTPGPSGAPTPVPYPNIAMSMDLAMGTTTVTVDGQMAAIQGSKFAKSTGDEPGVAGGVVSQVFIMEATFITFSPTVTMDGKPVCRLTDKMLMNRGNTACLGGVMQAPVPPTMSSVTVPSPNEEPKFCAFDHLRLTCGHDSRKYKLDAQEKPGTTIQVIADKKPEKVKLDFDGFCGVTSQSPGCAKVHVIDEQGKEVKLEADSSVQLRIPSNRDPKRYVGDWWDFIIHSFDLPSMKRDVYTVYGSTCNGSGTDEVIADEYALIEVFPNAGWELEISAGYKYEKKKLGKNRAGEEQTSPSQQDPQGQFELKGKVTAALATTDLSYELGKEGDGSGQDRLLSRMLFKTTQFVLDKLAWMLSSIESFYSTKLDIRWPALKLSGAMELAEAKEKPIVWMEGKFSIECKPLIGLQVQTDILEWLIRMAGAAAGPPGAVLAEYLLKVKKNIASGKTIQGKPQSKNGTSISADIGIVLTVGGDIGGAIGWKWSEHKCSIDASKAKIGGGIDFKLEALVKIEATIWILKACAGASIALVSADNSGPSRITGQLVPKPGKEPGVTDKLEFNGLAIYWAYYAELSLQANEANKPKAPEGKEPKSKVTRKPLYHTQPVKEEDVLCTLLEPWVWPKQNEPNVAKAL